MTPSTFFFSRTRGARAHVAQARGSVAARDPSRDSRARALARAVARASAHTLGWLRSAIRRAGGAARGGGGDAFADAARSARSARALDVGGAALAVHTRAFRVARRLLPSVERRAEETRAARIEPPSDAARLREPARGGVFLLAGLVGGRRLRGIGRRGGRGVCSRQGRRARRARDEREQGTRGEDGDQATRLHVDALRRDAGRGRKKSRHDARGL